MYGNDREEVTTTMDELEAAWFARGRSERPSRMPPQGPRTTFPPPSIDDPVADRWFR